MQKIKRLLLVLFLIFLVIRGEGQDLIQFLKSCPEITDIKRIQGNSFFNNTYEIMIRQLLDYKDTTKGYFLQRVFVSDKSPGKPVVFITEGYAASYMEKAQSINELCPMLNANQICVEHRYFGKSVPEPIDWQYLTVENAANDHHHIVRLFKKYFTGKWISTGISKGGQTALAFRAFFPNDVDATVAYVAPLNFGVEDGRHEPFLEHVGTAGCRERIRSFQKEILKRRPSMIPLLKDYCSSKKFTFPISMDEVLDFTVLEYSYAFWQWGSSCKEIPVITASDSILFNHLIKISSPDYFSYEGRAIYVPFFYQAAHELGYYGYDTKPFEGLLSIKTAKGYLNRFMAPGKTPVPYDGRTSMLVKNFLEKEATNVILIYGENDPWSASAASVRSKRNNLKIVNPGGCHKTRISSLPENMKKEVMRTLSKALN